MTTYVYETAEELKTAEEIDYCVRGAFHDSYGYWFNGVVTDTAGQFPCQANRFLYDTERDGYFGLITIDNVGEMTFAFRRGENGVWNGEFAPHKKF